jgi:hypothetical protein
LIEDMVNARAATLHALHHAHIFGGTLMSKITARAGGTGIFSDGLLVPPIMIPFVLALVLALWAVYSSAITLT